jgi:hypothetical protein
MIRKKRALHLMQGAQRFSFATNAERLGGDHAQSKAYSAMAIQPNPIAL